MMRRSAAATSRRVRSTTSTFTEIAFGWEQDATMGVVEAAQRWGLIRHFHTLRPPDIARAIAAVVAAPRGTALSVVDVQPEGALEEDES